MKPTTSRTTILFGLATLVALTAFFLVSVKRGARIDTLKSSVVLVQPLSIQGDLLALTREQKQEISNFRTLILARVRSKLPLTEQEKFVIKASIMTNKREPFDGMVPIDQSVYQFNDEELGIIAESLKK